MLALMSPMRNMVSNLGFPLLSLLLIFNISCSASNNQDPPSQNSASATPSVSPTPELVKIRQHDYFTIRFVSNEPIALLDVKLTKPDNPLKSGLVLEIQNKSDKPVKLVEYGIGPYELCSDYMYGTVPSPRIAYESGKESPSEPVLQLNDKAIIKVSNGKELRRFLNPKTYESCPEGYKKAILMLQEVHFADGGVWRPNARIFDEK
jgi:hypothetical protein